jgi:hypothetical protein
MSEAHVEELIPLDMRAGLIRAGALREDPSADVASFDQLNAAAGQPSRTTLRISSLISSPGRP